MKHYRIHQRGEDKGPYTIEQLGSMWQSGGVTADAQFWTPGMTTWKPVHELQLGGPARPPLPQHVVTKSNGSGMVAVGSIMCIVGVVLLMASSAGIVFTVIGGLLLFIGFIIAVIGRMMS